MAADTLRQECDERTGEYRENEAGEDRDSLQHSAHSACLAPHARLRHDGVLADRGMKQRRELAALNRELQDSFEQIKRADRLSAIGQLAVVRLLFA